MPDEEGFEEPVPEAGDLSLASYFSSGRGPKSSRYVDDFGDDWEHDVELKGIVVLPETHERRRRSWPD